MNAEAYYAFMARADAGFLGVVITAFALYALARLVKGLRPALFAWDWPALPPPLQAAALRYSPWLLAMTAVATRLRYLGESLWYDEAFTAAIARLPLNQLWQAVQGDVHPPLYYLIAWLAYRINPSEIGLRLPSLLLGLLAIYLVYRLTRRLELGQATALIAAGLTALLPAQIYYSGEARAYMLLTVLVIIALLGILENRPGLFVIGAALAPWTHNTGFVYSAVLGASAMLCHRDQLRWWMPVAGTGLAAALWLPFMAAQSAAMRDGFWLHPLTSGGLFMPLVEMTASLRINPAVALPVFVPLLLLTLHVLWEQRRWLISDQGRLVAAIALGVPALLALASILWQPVYLPRALLPAMTLLVILWAASARRQPLTAGLLGLAVSLALGSYLAGDGARHDLRAAFSQRCQDSPQVYYTDLPAQIIGQYYIDRPGALWPGAGDLNQALSVTAQEAFGFTRASLDDLKGTVCVLSVQTPLSSEGARAHLAAIGQMYPLVRSSLIHFNAIFSLLEQQIKVP